MKKKPNLTKYIQYIQIQKKKPSPKKIIYKKNKTNKCIIYSSFAKELTHYY